MSRNGFRGPVTWAQRGEWRTSCVPGSGSVVILLDIYRGNDDHVGATATMNFVTVGGLSAFNQSANGVRP